ncbi:MAG TPA: response regulator [Pirellulaceae bacterium]|nr:response regulator [Pirellulaceae bacterium]
MSSRILLAHSDELLLDLYQSVFADDGRDVEAVTNALQCVRSLDMFQPDLLILEWELPWGGGDGVLALLQDQRANIPVLVTHRNMPDQQRAKFTNGALVTCLPRPLRIHTMRAAVERALNPREIPAL